MKVILVYLLSILIASNLFSAILFVLMLLPQSFWRKHIKSWFAQFMGLLAFVSSFAAVWVISAIFNAFHVGNSILAILILGGLMINNNVTRIARIKNGFSPVRLMAGDEYNQKKDMQKEYADLIGNLIGLTLGVIYFL